MNTGKKEAQMGEKATKEEIANYAIREHRLFEKFRDGVLPQSEVLKAIQDIADRKFQIQTGGLVINSNGISLRTDVDHDRSIEELVADARKAGWWVNDSIKTDRQITIPGKTKKSGIKKETLKVSKIVPSGEVWKTKKVLSKLGKPGIEFGFPELMALIPHRDELLKAGIQYISAMGARFRHSDGDGCVVYLNPGDRYVYLYWIERAWNDNDDFGCAGK